MNKQANLPPQVVYQQYPEADDEIDISELFNKIWLRRKSIIASVFIAVVIAVGILALNMFLDTPQRRYSQILQFNFPNAEQGLYPAGQQFSYNDIVSAKVLLAVYKRNKLDEHGLKLEDFIDAIAVNPFAENAEFIKKKYQGLLANKKLTRPEIESLEKAYLDEIRAAQSRFARLSLIENDVTGLDEILVQKVLTDIPRVWSKVSIEELGVLDLKIAGADFYQGELVKRFEYLQTLEYLKDSAKYLGSALDLLVTDEIGGLVRNPKTGKSGYDLQVQLKNLVAFEVEPLFSTVTNLGITRDADKALIYLRNTIQNFQDKKEVLQKKAKNFEQIINQYAGGTLGTKGASQAGANGGFAQFDATFLDKFTALIEDKNDQAFKQELLKQRLEVLQDIEDLEGSIIKFQRAEERLVGSADNTSENVRKDVIDDIGMARQNFETLVGEYKALLAARNQQVLGNTASLYTVTSNDLLVDTDLIGRIKKMVLFGVLAGFVGLMLAVLVALFRKLPASSATTKTAE
jgi:hypothetical protein